MPTDVPSRVDAAQPAEDTLQRAWRDVRWDELVGPVQALVDLSARLLSDAEDLGRDDLSRDLRRIHDTATALRADVAEVLQPDRYAGLPPDEILATQRRIRHDMLNRLNPVINYSEMWLEEADEQFLQAFEQDFSALLRLGQKTFGLIDTILASWNLREVQPADTAILRSVEQSVRQMRRSELRKVSETGNLLVVDDSDVNRDILCRMLHAQGHTTLCAANGREALDLVSRHPIDAILLDIVMPEMDGFQVLQALKSDPALRDIPVIMISALSEMEFVVRCIELGAEDYLARPYNPVFLSARISASLEKLRFRQREKQYLTAIETERMRADSLLHVIFPAPIVAELKVHDQVAPRRYDNVAVMFADIVGFTHFCEQHSPESVVPYLQQAFEAWEDAAVRHGVQKIKTIGDAFMAASGLLEPVENGVLNCVRCGLEMLRFTEQLPNGWTLRVGIHCGRVMAGVLGKRQYLFDLFGDAVNTASRMESYGVPGSITLSPEAWANVAHCCDGEELPVREVKGKGPMRLMRVVGIRS